MAEVDLTSARLKLARAEEILGGLWGEVKAFFGEGLPIRVTGGILTTDEQGEVWESVRLDEIKRELPTRWGLLTGDAAHNMRSALDHLVCALAQLAGAPCETSQFPIYTAAPRSGWLSVRRSRLAGVPDEAADRIYDMQPYRDPSSRRSLNLVLLSYLDNYDKHRLVHALYTRSGEGTGALRFEGATEQPDAGRVTYHEGVLAVGDTLVRFPHRPGVEVVLTNITETGFGVPEATMERLRELRSEVAQIVESIVGFTVI